MMSQEQPQEELEAALRREFEGRKFILVDGRNDFLRESVSHGLERGLLREGESFEDSQYAAQTYVLTAHGKEYFGLE